MVESDSVGLLLGQFGLTTMRRELARIEQQALSGGWSLRQSLRELLETEAQAREQRRLARLLKESGLPEGKTRAALDEGQLGATNRKALAAFPASARSCGAIWPTAFN